MLVIPTFGVPRIQVAKKRTMNSRPSLNGYRVRHVAMPHQYTHKGKKHIETIV